jgi:hypothetical protein
LPRHEEVKAHRLWKIATKIAPAVIEPALSSGLSLKPKFTGVVPLNHGTDAEHKGILVRIYQPVQK